MQSSRPTSKFDELALGLAQVSFKNLQGWRSHDLSEQCSTLFSFLFFFTVTQTDFPMLQPATPAPRPHTMSHLPPWQTLRTKHTATRGVWSIRELQAGRQ